MGSRALTFTQITSPQRKVIMAPVIKQEPVDEPMSRTEEYRKVVKPLIERKRRARINNCLDELKDLMMFALQSEGESISKLEKADVLELTVKHLRKLKRQEPLRVRVPEPRVPKHLRMSSPQSDRGYDSGRDMTPSPLLQISPSHQQLSPVWRPF